MDQGNLSQESRPGALARISPVPLQSPEVVDVATEEALHLIDYWRVILKRRWVVLSCLLIVFSTVTIGTLKQKPIYAGKVLIEINPAQPNVLNFKEILQISSAETDYYRETQYRVLQSRALAELVVNDLHLDRIPEFYGKATPPGAQERNLPGNSDTAAFRNSVRHFQDSINVSPIRRSNLVEVSFSSQDPKLAAHVANKLADEYINQNLQAKWNEAERASEWLAGELSDLKGKLEKSEDALQTYAQANSILFVEEQQNLVNARLKEVQEEYTKAQAARFQKQSFYDLVQAGRVQDLPGFQENKLIQDLTERLAESQRDYAQLTATVKPEYPKAVALKKQIDTLQGLLDHQKMALQQSIVDEYRSAVANEKYLAQALDEAKKDVNNIVEKSIQYNILKREVDTTKQLYDSLLQRTKEVKVSAGVNASNIRIVDTAEVPKQPVKPRVLLNLALGMVLGLGLGIGLAFFQEYLDNTLKTPDEVETLLRLPSLGVLPTFAVDGADKAGNGKRLSAASRREQSLAPAIQTNRSVVEAFRSLRTSILLSANPVPKTLLITSALPGEGKTSTSVNLGATLASLGNKVVIVDCDMRRPACHRSTGVENKPGFVQCLTGHVDLPAAILPVPGVENLSVIPCGPIPPNPAEVLSSPLTGELLQKLRAQFEYVIVDSPPLLSVADSRILATLTDAVVLVTRAHSTPYDAVCRARSLLYGASARILGVALNDVDLRKHGYGYGSGYGYYYRYGYGYGYGDSTPTEAEDPDRAEKVGSSQS